MIGNNPKFILILITWLVINIQVKAITNNRSSFLVVFLQIEIRAKSKIKKERRIRTLPKIPKTLDVKAKAKSVGASGI